MITFQIQISTKQIPDENLVYVFEKSKFSRVYMYVFGCPERTARDIHRIDFMMKYDDESDLYMLHHTYEVCYPCYIKRVIYILHNWQNGKTFPAYFLFQNFFRQHADQNVHN